MGPSTRPRRLVWAGAIVLGVVAAATLLTIAAFVLFTWIGLSHRHAWPLEESLGSLSVSMTARWHAGSRRNPLQDTPRTLALGQTGYRPCVECHGVQGDGQADLGSSLFPVATNLLGPSTKNMTDAQLFWIIKNGLSFTAMPAYDTQYSDEAIWAIVSYVRALQQGSAIAFGPPPTTDTPPVADGTGSDQRFRLALTDTALQPSTLTARPGTIRLDLANSGARGHLIVISGSGKVPFNAGRVLPTQSLPLQGKLAPGDYSIAVDPGGANPGPVTTLNVR